MQHGYLQGRDDNDGCHLYATLEKAKDAERVYYSAYLAEHGVFDEEMVERHINDTHFPLIEIEWDYFLCRKLN